VKKSAETDQLGFNEVIIDAAVNTDDCSVRRVRHETERNPIDCRVLRRHQRVVDDARVVVFAEQISLRLCIIIIIVIIIIWRFIVRLLHLRPYRCSTKVIQTSTNS